MEFKDRLKELRETKSLTQKQLAQSLGVSRATISGYETKGNQPDHEKLVLLSNYLGVSIDYLIRGTTPTYSTKIYEVVMENTIDKEVQKKYVHLSAKSKKAVLDYINYMSHLEATAKQKTKKLDASRAPKSS